MNLWESFLDLLFPPKCPFCQKILDDPRAPVCPECQGKLPWLLGEDALRAVEGTAGCLSPLAYRDEIPGKSQLWEALWASHGSVRPGQPDRSGGCGDLDPAEPKAEEKAGL